MLKIIFLILATCTIQKVSPQSPNSLVQHIGDTLFIQPDKKIVAGQKLRIGKGSYERGWFHYISFKNYGSLPLLFNRKFNLQYEYSARSDPEQERTNDLVKTYLEPGDSVIIKKLKLRKGKNEPDWYRAILITKKFQRLRFYTNIVKAIETNELLVQ